MRSMIELNRCDLEDIAERRVAMTAYFRVEPTEEGS